MPSPTVDIFEEIVRLRQAGTPAALATIVGTRGSTPGQQSMRLLVKADGSFLGTVGGGCLEAEVYEAALEVIRADYIRTSRAKGLGERKVVGKHAFKNAVIPVMTIAGIDLGALMGGAILTETVFSRPGIGLMIFQAIGSRDVPVVAGGVLFATVVYVFANLFVDLGYAAVDPRIRLEE